MGKGSIMKLLGILILILVAGCVTTIESDIPFDSREVEFVKIKGSSTIKGELFALQQGGGVVIGAGREVFLVPVSKHQIDIVKKLYGNTENGFRHAAFHPKVKHPAEFYEYQIKKITNSKGEFVFNNISPGDYFLFSAVTWIAGTSTQGGTVMQRVMISQNETKEVLLKF